MQLAGAIKLKNLPNVNVRQAKYGDNSERGERGRAGERQRKNNPKSEKKNLLNDLTILDIVCKSG